MIKKLREILDTVEPHVEKGGKYEKAFTLFEAVDTFLFTPKNVTKSGAHVRDAIDLKRMMITVIVALQPAILMAQYNTGLQANRAIEAMGLSVTPSAWRAWVMDFLGLGYSAHNVLDNFVHGLLYFVPIFLVTQMAGGLVELIFATVRKHELNEGFLVTGMLYPLTLPPDIPLWQVAVGIMFGVFIAKEIFGGTGKNFLNVALTARAFLFFAYPTEISGDSVWVAVDGYSGATALSVAATDGLAGLSTSFNWLEAAVGFVPGSMGETSAIACLMGAGLLIAAGVASWRIMLSMVVGTALTVTLFNIIGSDSNPFFDVPFWWHFVIGSFMFGMAFMATDPVTASYTEKGKIAYGLLIGVMVALVRVVNPAYPEGVMLAILFSNAFAPLFDYFVIKANIKRRTKRYGQ